MSDIGYRNIQNLRNLGVDHIDVSPNPVLRRKINKFTLNEIGDISWPEHLTMFTTPIRIAAMFGIKLIFGVKTLKMNMVDQLEQKKISFLIEDG